MNMEGKSVKEMILLWQQEKAKIDAAMEKSKSLLLKKKKNQNNDNDNNNDNNNNNNNNNRLTRQRSSTTEVPPTSSSIVNNKITDKKKRPVTGRLKKHNRRQSKDDITIKYDRPKTTKTTVQKRIKKTRIKDPSPTKTKSRRRKHRRKKSIDDSNVKYKRRNSKGKGKGKLSARGLRTQYSAKLLKNKKTTTDNKSPQNDNKSPQNDKISKKNQNLSISTVEVEHVILDAKQNTPRKHHNKLEQKQPTTPTTPILMNKSNLVNTNIEDQSKTTEKIHNNQTIDIVKKPNQEDKNSKEEVKKVEENNKNNMNSKEEVKKVEENNKNNINSKEEVKKVEENKKNKKKNISLEIPKRNDNVVNENDSPSTPIRSTVNKGNANNQEQKPVEPSLLASLAGVKTRSYEEALASFSSVESYFDSDSESNTNEKKKSDESGHTRRPSLSDLILASVDDSMRRQALDELFSTERSYCKKLADLISIYMKPMLDQKSSLKITDEDISSLFSNIEIIMNLHHTFLSDLEKEGEEGNIAPVMTRFAHYFKMYGQYVSSYDQRLLVIQKLTKNKKFQNFLQEKRNECGGLDIMSFLIMPVQRIPRYELLLREILKNTPVTHKDYESLDEAFKKVHDVADTLNERKRQIESMSAILEIQQTLRNIDYSQIPSGVNSEKDTIVIPTRQFEYKDHMMVKIVDSDSLSVTNEKSDSGLVSSDPALNVSASKQHGRKRSKFANFLFKAPDFKEREVILFNDCIIWCSLQGKFKGCLQLKSACVMPDVLLPTRFTLKAFNIKDNKIGTILLESSSQAIRDEWIERLERMIKKVDNIANKRKLSILKSQQSNTLIDIS